METFGQKLRKAIQSRGMTLERVAGQTGIQLRYLEALAQDDHGALPDDGSVIPGLRALAQILGVDPDQVIEDYLREREVFKPVDSPLGDVVPDASPSPMPSDFQESPQVTNTITVERSDGSRGLLAFGAVVAVMAIGGMLWLRSSALGEARPAAPAPGSEAPAESGKVAPVGEEPTIAEPQPAGEETPVPPMNRTRTETPPAMELSMEQDGSIITDHGVGAGVRNHQLVGEADRFAEGKSVFFWTLVEGAAGERIRHVWLHDGEEVLSVPLRIGSDRWRTHSYKNLHPGSTGHWVVEARDSQNRVLAREAFDCFESTRR